MGNETQPFNAERSCQGAVRATKSWRIFSRGSCVPCRRNSLPKMRRRRSATRLSQPLSGDAPLII